MKVGSFFSSPALTEVMYPLQKKPLFLIQSFFRLVKAANWDKFKDAFKSRSEFRKSIEAMANLQDPPLNDAADAFSSTDYHVLRKPLRTILKNLTPQRLGDLFTLLVDKSIEEGKHDSLHRCLALITPQELEPLVKEGIAASAMTPEETLQVFALAEKEYRKLVTSTELSFSDKHVQTFGRMVRNFIDACLLSFRISDIGKEVTSSWEANEKIMAYTRLFGGPLVLFTALCTVCPVAVAFAVTAVLTVTLGFGALIYIKWFQESPETIYLTTNLVDQAREGALPPVFAREAEIDEILQALASSSESHRSHPLLCGPSGVGKTEIVRGIAQRLATGNVPDCLKGKKLISINTADLLDKHPTSGGEDRLQIILNKMGRNKKDYIVFFDEVHNAMINKLQIGERLKTVLDTNPNSLPYCIGATTTEEYERHISPNLAFARRFQKMEIKPTNMKQTVLILREMMKREAPELTVADDVLEAIYTKSSEKLPQLFQPFSSKSVLAYAISHVQLPVSPSIQIKQQELSNLSSALHGDPTTLRGQETLQVMQNLQREIDELTHQRIEFQKKNQLMNKLVAFKSKQVTELFKMALKASDSGDVQPFTFWNYYLLPQVVARIAAKKSQEAHSAGTEITSSLVDQLFVKYEQQAQKLAVAPAGQAAA